jgi:hypothetical protein
MTADEHPVSEKGMTRRRRIAGFSIKEFSQPPLGVTCTPASTEARDES